MLVACLGLEAFFMYQNKLFSITTIFLTPPFLSIIFYLPTDYFCLSL